MAQALGAEVTGGDDPVPIKLFRGYDTVARGLLTASAVSGDFERSEVSSDVKVEVCDSLTELAEALEIDASLSVSYLKAVDVTAKMEFARKLNVTARSVTIVVYARHGIGTWDATNVTLKDNVKAPIDAKSAAAFVKTHGDSFVRSVTLGGEYFAVYVFNTETREQQQSLAASLKGEVKGGAATVKADAQLKLTNFLKTTKTNWTVKEGMTGILNPEFPDKDKLIPFALDFSKLTLSAPVAINVKVTGYEDLPEFDDSFDKVVENRTHFLHPKRGLLPKLSRLTALANQCDWLKKIYRSYGYEGDTALGAFADKVDADMDSVDAQIAQWKSNALRNFAVPALSSLMDGEPVLSFQEELSPAWGPSGPTPWSVDSVGDLIRNRTRVKSIQIASGKYENYVVLGQLVVAYESDKRSWTETYGGGSAQTVQARLDLEEGQFPARFQVRAGTWLDWLQIQLSDGRSSGAGGPGGVLTEWAVPEGAFFVGFAGRSGTIIDQLQIRYAKLNAAKMVKTA